MPKIQFPFWMRGERLTQWAECLTRWFEWVRQWLIFPIQQFDAETAQIQLVDLWAWERDIARFQNEPEWLYRRRVKFAYANARDAGTVAGFMRIWARMALGALEIEERIDGRDWDVIRLVITEHAIAEQPALLDLLIEQYGRTCRRYEWTTKTTLRLWWICDLFEYESEHFVARV